jgi:thiol-disulfide isomerase/thioredoxin
MKYLYTVLCILIAAVNLHGQATSFKLEGKNAAIYDGYKAYLYVKSDDLRKVLFLDSALLKDGKFNFAGPLTQPSSNASIKLVLRDQQYFAEFALDTGFNEVHFKPAHLLGRVFVDIGLRSASNILKMKIDSIDRKAYADERAAAKDKSGFATLSRSRNHQRDLKCLEAIEKFPDHYYSLVSLYLLERNVSMTEYVDLALEALNKLSPELRSTALGRKLKESATADISAKAASVVGQSGPVFNVKDGQNRTFTNKTMLGQPHLLVFTATWCVPCQKQLPKLRKISERYEKQGLKIVYVSMDKDLDKWNRHVKTVPANWVQVFDRAEGQQQPISKMYYITGVPTYFLIDAAGKIAYNLDTLDPQLLETEKYIQQVIR